jgi:hypothetical protein
VARKGQRAKAPAAAMPSGGANALTPDAPHDWRSESIHGTKYGCSRCDLRADHAELPGIAQPCPDPSPVLLTLVVRARGDLTKDQEKQVRAARRQGRRVEILNEEPEPEPVPAVVPTGPSAPEVAA